MMFMFSVIKQKNRNILIKLSTSNEFKPRLRIK